MAVALVMQYVEASYDEDCGLQGYDAVLSCLVTTHSRENLKSHLSI